MEYNTFKNHILALGQSIKFSISKIMEPIVEAQGLTILQTMILLGIKNGKVCNLSSLNKEIGTGQANASTICKKLENSSFIIRERDKLDERIVNLYLTKKAEAAILNIEKESEKYNYILQQIPSEKFDLIVNGIEAMNEVLQQMVEYKNDVKEEN